MCPSRLRRSTQVVTESTGYFLTPKLLAMALLLPGDISAGWGAVRVGSAGLWRMCEARQLCRAVCAGA